MRYYVQNTPECADVVLAHGDGDVLPPGSPGEQAHVRDRGAHDLLSRAERSATLPMRGRTREIGLLRALIVFKDIKVTHR